jgi:deferrochelatase/peroxidase EfeB
VSEGPRVTRRRLIGTAAAGGLAAGAAGATGGFAIGRSDAEADTGSQVVPFRGPHQAGIATPAQDRLHFASFDMTSRSRSDLRDLLRTWTEAAERMTAGRRAGDRNNQRFSPPEDTGEAEGLHAANLTITVGFGPSLFDGRFGLRGQRPAALKRIPTLPGDEIDPSLSDGDLCVQACADDPQVAFHAVRNLTRLASGVAVMRWCQLGFGRTARTSRDQSTPRNLMGFKDGTNNVTAQDATALRNDVWVGREGPGWMTGGAYVVTRRIRMLIEAWDRTGLGEQEQTFGRHKDSGAPFGTKAEFDTVPLDRGNADGTPLIPVDAHIRLAAPSRNAGSRLLRRGYSFTDGFDPQRGQLDAGLFFICFQRDPEKQFVAIQRRLGAHDALNEYIVHESSAVFAVPPGVRGRGDWLGRELLENS